MNASFDSTGSQKTEDAKSSATADTAIDESKPSDKQAIAGNSTSAQTPQPDGEEPSIALEPDLPSDGRDAVGEAMIRDLPQSPELSEPPSQPDPSNQAK